MKTGFLKLMTLVAGIATAALVAAWWVFRGQPLIVGGVVAFLLLLVLCAILAYRYALLALGRIEHAAARSDALLELARQSINAGKRQAGSIRALAAGQVELLRLQAAGETTQRLLAEKLAVVEEASRSASRQSSGSQELTLRAFRDVSAMQKNLGTSAIEGLASLRSDLASVGKKLSDKIDSERTALTNFTHSDKNLRMLAHRALGRMQYETVQEVEALAQLRRLFDVRVPTPLLGGFAMQPVSMLAVVEEVLHRKPGLMVECGSGASTLWIAQALARNGKGRLVSLEHLEEYFDKTLRSLQQHGLERWVDLRLAPLREVAVNGEPFQWYDTKAITDLADIDILSVDGPPGFIGPLARYPALPLLREKLAVDALILVDDADREDEQALMDRWKAEISGLWKSWKLAGRTHALAYRSKN